MDKLGLFVGLILSIIGMYYIDKNILLSFELNQSKWFGKYVFFAAFNILVLWVLWVFYKKFRGILKILMPLLFGIIILFIGVKLA
ncbi:MULTISPECIES: hypothetical protein [unclassified Lebetimonas]|uniref:hypothetical protein n=1 Tax=unclassified Lebetimonas TaxID=2648158 RepID=UPI0004645A93|nr:MULTISPECIES: hypothetical protein [unclassified Lebetimonas]